MITQDCILVPRIFHPQQNLKQVKSPEAELCISFAQYYKKHFNRIHSNGNSKNTLFLREMPVSESGIADLVVLSWNSPQSIDVPFQIRAFELKIADWQSGIVQAFRYKSYSNAAIVVLPVDNIAPALRKKNIFISSGVGLWGFDNVNMTLHRYYTPRPKKPTYLNKRDRLIKSIPKYYEFNNCSYFSIDSENTSK